MRAICCAILAFSFAYVWMKMSSSYRSLTQAEKKLTGFISLLYFGMIIATIILCVLGL